jgi:FixJ family two-component response regulator
MPDMLGTEFFQILSESHPDIIRILVTAYADTEAVMLAINKGQVYRFITKPWNKNELKVTIDNAFEAYDLKMHNQILVSNLTENNKELEDLNFRLMIEVAERTKAEEELASHRNNLEKLISQRTQEIENINNELALTNQELTNKNEELYAINEELELANKRLYHEVQIRTQVQEMLAES